ncbi:hypothetical protein D3C87_422270 [compost metagenome]
MIHLKSNSAFHFSVNSSLYYKPALHEISGSGFIHPIAIGKAYFRPVLLKKSVYVSKYHKKVCIRVKISL